MSARLIPLAVAVALLWCAPGAYAQSAQDQQQGGADAQAGQGDQQLAPVPEPPPLPPKLKSGETIEPDVTITRGEKQTIYEYRINGQLRAVKVVPDIGPPYYLVDTNGNGQLDTRQRALGPDFLINGWVLFTW